MILALALTTLVIAADTVATIQTEAYTVTVTTSSKKGLGGVLAKGSIGFGLRVENSSESPLPLDPSRIAVKGPTGNSVDCIAPDQAVAFFLRSRLLLRALTLGGSNDRNLALERDIQADWDKDLFRGPVPAKSFREGNVICRGLGSTKDRTLEVVLQDLNKSVEVRWK